MAATLDDFQAGTAVAPWSLLEYGLAAQQSVDFVLAAEGFVDLCSWAAAPSESEELHEHEVEMSKVPPRIPPGATLTVLSSCSPSGSAQGVDDPTFDMLVS